MLLSVDTSTHWIGIALYTQNQVLGEMVWQTKTHHSVELAPSIANLLLRCQSTPQDLKALAVALGPGSFTSLRIGLAVVKGMALGLHIPVIGVPSFDILAAAQPVVEKTVLMTLLQAGRGRAAVSTYQVVDSTWKTDGEIRVLPYDEIGELIKGPTLVCGEIEDTLRQSLERKRKKVIIASPANNVRRPSILAEIGWRRWLNNQVDEVVSLAPIYIHTGEPLPA
jgi:tRNA threonylcarbamoyladenosine biosynthesis protein TsaB